jgi:hypothetical protein
MFRQELTTAMGEWRCRLGHDLGAWDRAHPLGGMSGGEKRLNYMKRERETPFVQIFDPPLDIVCRFPEKRKNFREIEGLEKILLDNPLFYRY